MTAFHQFDVPTDAGPDFWTVEVAQMLQDALDELPDYRFDAVVVDEGQDFHTDWFIVLEDCHRSQPGPLYVFFDRAQNLYSKNLQFPDSQTKYKLKRNCRNTKRIAEACEHTIGETIRVAAFSPEGEAVEFFQAKDGNGLREAVVSALDLWVKQEKIALSRIAILTHHKPERTMLGQGKVGNHSVTADLATWRADKAVWVSTIKAFKGMEADVLFLVDLPEVETEHFGRSDLYVAASRARLRLLVFSGAKSVREGLSDQI